MAVRIRMKKMGRAHRPFYRICATDGHAPRDGKVLEELGTYDTSVRNVDARAILKKERIDYWVGVGAQPSDKVKVLIKKYGTNGTHLSKQETALDTIAQPKAIPDPGKPTFVVKPAEEESAAPAEAAPEAAAEGTAEEAPAETAEAPAEEAVAEAPAATEEASAEGDAEEKKSE